MKKNQVAMQFTKEPYIEDVGPRKIESIQFSTLSATEMRKFSEVQVSRGFYYNEKREPYGGGLLDQHMGPAGKHGKCETCGENFYSCPGHSGGLTLELPVFHVGYFPTIVKIMKCICKKCSIILLGEKERQDFLKQMRNPKADPLKKDNIREKVVKKCDAMAKRKEHLKCSRCGYINGIVRKGNFQIQHDRGRVLEDSLDECKHSLPHIKGSPSIIDAKMALQLLKNMRNEDCELLYVNGRPENLMVSEISVPPTAVRPSHFVDGGGTQSNENDISERLGRIIQANAKLRSEISESNSLKGFLERWEVLQLEVAQYINGDVPGNDNQQLMPRPLSGFIQRLKGKKGRFRENLSGKRVEFTGRTVISPDPNLKINEVAVPLSMAQILTYPERVSHHNIEKLRQCVRNGPDKYPGARFLKKPDGEVISLKIPARRRLADELRYGTVVHRHLENGDIILFNRQPSLHRMSMMSHRARIMPWRTLRFNESVCNPYNADFDGDEMNMHVPQTEEARTEALMLMQVQNNLCTPKNGEILVASTQDFLTSSFLITRKDTFYDRSGFSLMCSCIGDAADLIDLPTPALLKPVELWTGKQLFSVLMRPHAKMRVYVNLTVKEKNYGGSSRETMSPEDGFVYIRNSELISGQLGKATLGNGNKNGVYSVLLRDYGPHAAAACMNRLAKLSARWIGNHGFSIGIDDVQAGDALNKDKKTLLDKEYDSCTDHMNSYRSGKLELLPGSNNAETLEAKIFGTLNDIRGAASKVCMKKLDWRNSPLIMAQCGSKGSEDNICQMIACVGQQSVGGHRPRNGFVDRTLPHFDRGAKDPDAKGFVENSFYTGLSATEFFFHSMGGREGLVDSAVKTAETGYLSRRLIKGLEDLDVAYDNTVRNASGCIVQLEYGDDAMDPGQMEGENGLPLNFERLFMKAKATCPATEMKSLKTEEIMEIVNKTIERKLSKSPTTFEGGCTNSVPSSDAPYKDGYLDYFSESIRKFIEKKCSDSHLKLKLGEGKYSEEDRAYLEHVASTISGISSQQLMVFLETCISRFHSKKIEARTPVGVIGAQSIGEPGTQMTLKTFHFAGLASMNVTRGFPRIKEIINAAKRIKTPIIAAFLQCENCEKSAKIVKDRIERTHLKQVANSIEIKRESGSASIVITLDMTRIQDDQLSIDAHSVKESILRDPIMKRKKHQITVSSSEEVEIILKADKRNPQFELKWLESKLPKVVVKGINSVERARVAYKDESKVPDPSKGYKLLVEGSGLLSVLGTEGVDSRKTKSNDILDVQKTLGIEAARRTIIQEIHSTMQEMKIDKRHMMLLADLMTFKGEVLGFTRDDIKKTRNSVLMLASFEKTADHLFNAGVSGKVDKIEGVSECIIMGIPMPMGTGGFKLMQSRQPVQLVYGPDSILR